MTVQRDNLPIDGFVKIEGSDRLYVYVGWDVRDFNRCALRLTNETTHSWYDRATIRVVEVAP